MGASTDHPLLDSFDVLLQNAFANFRFNDQHVESFCYAGHKNFSLIPPICCTLLTVCSKLSTSSAENPVLRNDNRGARDLVMVVQGGDVAKTRDCVRLALVKTDGDAWGVCTRLSLLDCRARCWVGAVLDEHATRTDELRHSPLWWEQVLNAWGEQSDWKGLSLIAFCD